MSVVNRMLQDLDRQARRQASLASVASAVPTRPSRWPQGLLLMLAVAVAAALVWHWPVASIATPAATRPAPVTPAPVQQQPAPALITPALITPAQAEAPPPAEPAASKPVPTPLPAPLPNPEALVAAEAAEDARLVPVFPVLPPYGVALEAAATPESVALASSESPAAGPALVQKTPSHTPTSRAEAYYQQALAALDAEQNAEVEQALQQALALDPGHAAARQLWTSEALAAGKPEEAARRLAPALQSAATDPAWRLLAARITLAQGKPEQAYQQLSAHAPAVHEALDYHATLAALEQQLGHAGQAAERYDALLRLRPEEAGWWLGLGLALDAQQQTAAARQAYRRAVALKQLSGAALAHAERRAAGD